MDAHQEHTQSHAWEMGMFQVDGKNPPPVTLSYN